VEETGSVKIELPYRVLALDGALEKAGYAVVETSAKHRLKALDYGVIKIKPHKNPLYDHPHRLGQLYQRVLALLDEYNPHAIASEEFFMGVNHKTGMFLNRATGAIMLAAVHYGQGKLLPVYEYPPAEWKAQAVNFGGATKEQVAFNMRLQYELPEIVAGDAADALGIALAHLAAHNYLQLRLL
jgi:crossover junction endodeoxyribonuclease RuvC